MYILSVEGVTILPVETAEEIAEWLLKTPLKSLEFRVLFFFSKMFADDGLQVGASFVLVMRTNFDERMFN
jgi:hypothetical protein